MTQHNRDDHATGLSSYYCSIFDTLLVVYLRLGVAMDWPNRPYIFSRKRRRRRALKIGL